MSGSRCGRPMWGLLCLWHGARRTDECCPLSHPIAPPPPSSPSSSPQRQEVVAVGPSSLPPKINSTVYEYRALTGADLGRYRRLLYAPGGGFRREIGIELIVSRRLLCVERARSSCELKKPGIFFYHDSSLRADTIQVRNVPFSCCLLSLTPPPHCLCSNLLSCHDLT